MKKSPLGHQSARSTTTENTKTEDSRTCPRGKPRPWGELDDPEVSRSHVCLLCLPPNPDDLATKASPASAYFLGEKGQIALWGWRFAHLALQPFATLLIATPGSQGCGPPAIPERPSLGQPTQYSREPKKRKRSPWIAPGTSFGTARPIQTRKSASLVSTADG